MNAGNRWSVDFGRSNNSGSQVKVLDAAGGNRFGSNGSGGNLSHRYGSLDKIFAANGIHGKMLGFQRIRQDAVETDAFVFNQSTGKDPSLNFF